MAQVTRREKKDGTVSYTIRVYSGRTQSDKVITRCKTVVPPPGMSGKKVEKWVQEQAMLFEQQVTNGMALDSDMLLDDLIDRWFEEYANKHLKPKTLYDYKRMRPRITAGLGHLKVSKIKPAHLMAFYDNLEEKGIRQDSSFTATAALLKLLPHGTRGALAKEAGVGQDTMRMVYAGKGVSKRTAEKVSAAVGLAVSRAFNEHPKKGGKLNSNSVLHYHAMLSSVFRKGVQWGLINENPCARAERPKASEIDVETLDEEDIARLLEALAGAPVHFSVITQLALLTGARRGEICGLRWSDIDFEKGTLSIKRTVQFIPAEGIVFTSPKTKRSRRCIRIGADCLELLKEYRQHQIQERLRIGSKWARKVTIENGKVVDNDMEKLCRGDEKDQKELAELLAHHRIIVTDECHYWSEFSSFNINTHYSLEAILVAEKDHTVVYMSATGQDTWKLIEEQGGPTSPEHIYRLPQSYEHVKAAYFYARYNLVAILKNLPAGEKAIVFVEMGDDLVEMEKIFGDAAGYYCSPYNERYQKKYSDLSCCVKDGRQLKDILFTTKAMGVGIGIKDRTVKHIFIDQWHPLEIAQSLGRKRTLDADDTCTVYFRDYGLDWYWGTNSGLKKFRNMLLTKYQPAQAYIAGEEEFEKYLHSDTPEVIQKRIDKSKILEHNVVTGYHLNPLGVRQVKNDLEMLYDIMGMKSYPEAFMKYAMFDLHQPIKAYRFKDLEEWLYAHLNQPMNPEEMTAEIIKFGYIERYYDRMPGQVKLNDWLQGYGVKIVSDRDRRRGENYQTMY